MLKSLLKLLPGKAPPTEESGEAVFQLAPPAQLEAPGVAAFDFVASLTVVNGLPTPDWSAVGAWVASIPEPSLQAEAWAKAELAWLAHLQVALGEQYTLAQHEYAILLSPLEPRVATATVQFMTKTLSRISRVLDGVAKAPEWGRDILLVFEDEDTYYRYASRYYPEDGEFALSGGMHINFGCSHFATFQAELRAIEPVIAHEMTHGCLGHLSIPAWLNEGIAVNTERRLCPPASQQYTPQQLHWMHQQFWNETTIQEFWSGKSFLRPDEGNLLSYDLARILVEQFSRDWESFKPFVQEAQLQDAGREAASKLLGVELGSTVIALFDFQARTSWSPDPVRWESQPERGAFCARSDA
jgi:hypothetical protein